MTDRAASQFSVMTLFPEMFDALRNWGVTGRAFDRGLCDLTLVNPRDFATDRHGTVDDRPYGGGPGMVMQAPVLDKALDAARASAGCEARVVAMTPQGRPFDDAMAREMAGYDGLILVAGRYEGFDERFLNRSVDLEVSVGDFVVSGGELPAMLVLDAVIRLLPGVLGHQESAAADSFAEGLLDFPHYTRPEVYKGEAVPPVLMSGDHGAIARWRRAQALRRTLARRPDLLGHENLSEDDQRLLAEWAETHK